MDAAEIRLLKASWLQEWGMFLPIGDVGSRERRTWWAWRLLTLLSGALLPILWMLADILEESALSFLVWCAFGLAFLASSCAAVALLAVFLDRLLATLRPARVSLTAQRLRIEEIGAVCELPLDEIRSIAEHRWGDGLDPAGDSLAVLRIGSSRRDRTALEAARTRDVRWLVRVIEAALAQRRSALLAAGHDTADLARPPPEAEALRAVAEQVGERARSGL